MAALNSSKGLPLDDATPDLGDFTRDPFYASVFPLYYALSATTVIAYLLLIMLLIAPRSFLDGGVVTLGRHSFSNSPSGGVSIGGRPWLQKVATLFTAVALTIASHDTFRVTESQYWYENFDVKKLQQEVLNGTQLQVIQLISDTFLWLAQAQTLIRLFPRQREKIVIKWAAFTLITLNLIFSTLDSFRYNGSSSSRPQQFTEAIPALSYLFELALGLLYAAWVLYYSLTKKRYAFYHHQMKNIPLVASLSIIALLIPVVFFVLDIAESGVAVWGDYVRWVGAAAASVVVWEWVERIEALEREERKDGVLGREIFDGDDLIEASPSDLLRSMRKKNRKSDGHDNGGDISMMSLSESRGSMWPAMSGIARTSKSTNHPHNSQQQSTAQGIETGASALRFKRPPIWPSRPHPAATPVSRADTASADSTIYAVRYQPLTETTSRTTEERPQPSSPINISSSSPARSMRAAEILAESTTRTVLQQSEPEVVIQNVANSACNRSGYLKKLNPFHNRKQGPPAEVLKYTTPSSISRRECETLPRWDIRGRMEGFAATQAERILQQIRPAPNTESLSVMRVPAPPRRGAALAQLLEEENLENFQTTGGPPASSSLSAAPRHQATGGVRMTGVGGSTPSRRGQNAREADVTRSRPLHPSSPEHIRGSSDLVGNRQQRERRFGERRPIDDILRDEPQTPPHA
ncbi:PalH/RIM21-domain-containing protein [Xylariaceae sp. FL0255]|nr:PalH/RIM21-domain-containing protein [Xylariaceae sp. FL0255]